MLYIEASQINSNGGIVLLDLLLRRIKERNIDAIIYIGYGHVLNRLKYLESKNIRLVRTSLFKTFVRYVSRRNKVLFLCNLPPFRRNLSSIIYIHNLFFAERPKWTNIYNPQIQISAESETKRSIFREKDKTKRSKKESAQHSKSRNKSFVMTSVSAL